MKRKEDKPALSSVEEYYAWLEGEEASAKGLLKGFADGAGSICISTDIDNILT